MSPSVLTIIPARMGSSRFPGKPMTLINGVPMIFHVLENCLKSTFSSNVVVATPDEEIYESIASKYSENCVTYTSPSHERASDRAAEALLILEAVNNVTYDIVTMVQGDEPCLTSASIDSSIAFLIDHPDVSVVNLASEIHNTADIMNPNIIKLVIARNSNALYFSRSPIPSNTRCNLVSYLKQVCCIPFRRDALLLFNSLEETELEVAESVDMLRLLENNIDVKIYRIHEITHPVDVPEDVLIVESILAA